VDKESHSLKIDHYQINDISNNKTKVTFSFNQQTYKVKVYFAKSLIKFTFQIINIYYNNTGLGKSIVAIKSCCFSCNHDNLFYTKSYTTLQGNAIWIENCSVTNHYMSAQLYLHLQRVIGVNKRVIYNGFRSTPIDVTSGVPQRIVLGLLLFLVYINYLPDCISSSCSLFADDCLLYRKINNKAD